MEKTAYQFGSLSDRALYFKLWVLGRSDSYLPEVAETILMEQRLRADITHCGPSKTSEALDNEYLSKIRPWRSAYSINVDFHSGNKLVLINSRLKTSRWLSAKRMISVHSFDERNRRTSLVHECYRLVNPEAPAEVSLMQSTRGYRFPIGDKHLSQLVSLCFEESAMTSRVKPYAWPRGVVAVYC